MKTNRPTIALAGTINRPVNTVCNFCCRYRYATIRKLPDDCLPRSNEKTTPVNSPSLSCLCCVGFPPGRCRFSATSTGKYKSKKIGFSLCYLGEQADKVKTAA